MDCVAVPTSPDVSSDYPFDDAEHVLRWAYRQRLKSEVPSQLGKAYRAPAVRSDEERRAPVRPSLFDDLCPASKHMQATQIIAIAARVLEPIERLYAGIKFGRQDTAIPSLAWFMQGCVSDPMPGDGNHKIIIAYCGRPIGIAAIRKELGCRTQTASEYQKRCYDWLDTIHNSAMSRLDSVFRAKGFYE